MVKTHISSAGGAGSIPDRGLKIFHAVQLKKIAYSVNKLLYPFIY